MVNDLFLQYCSSNSVPYHKVWLLGVRFLLQVVRSKIFIAVGVRFLLQVAAPCGAQPSCNPLCAERQ